MYGNLNPGLLMCRCLDTITGSPIEGAGVILTWIQAEVVIGGRLPLFDTKGIPSQSVEANTDSSGIAFVEFFWEPEKSSYLLSSDPKIRVSAIGPAARYERGSRPINKLYQTTRVTDKKIYECINLGQVMSGGGGFLQFKSEATDAIWAASKIKEYIAVKAKAASEKLPKLQILKVMRPGIEMLSLVGGFDIEMNPM